MTDSSAHELNEISRITDRPNRWRLLVVDDDPHVRRTLARMLALLGHLISEASSGKEAEILALENVFDAIVTDLRLPDVPGHELIHSLRKIYPTLGAVIVSGFSDYEEIQRGVNDGRWQLLNKPFEFETLEKAVNIAIENRPKTRA